jgi:hypothetical protein
MNYPYATEVGILPEDTPATGWVAAGIGRFVSAIDSGHALIAVDVQDATIYVVAVYWRDAPDAEGGVLPLFVSVDDAGATAIPDGI